MEYISRQPYKDRFMQLASKFDYARGFGDCHGHTLIIKGMAEALIDPVVKPYDIAASKICLEEAGGILTDINGNASIYNGTAILSNGSLHQRIIEGLK
jgi:fructose-1,6-bisphosphatase/inositol monophosphatase family enzyme